MCTMMPHAAILMDQLSTPDSFACRVEHGIKIYPTIALSIAFPLWTSLFPALRTKGRLTGWPI
jgi:hypothetical protein